MVVLEGAERGGAAAAGAVGCEAMMQWVPDPDDRRSRMRRAVTRMHSWQCEALLGGVAAIALLILPLTHLESATTPVVPIVAITKSPDRQSVEIRLKNGASIRYTNHGDVGFENPLVAPDHETAAWSILDNIGFSYPIPTGIEVVRPGTRLDRPLGCDGGAPFHWWFWSNGRDIVLDCAVAHGPPGEIRVLVDVQTGRRLARTSYDDQTGGPVGQEPAWSVRGTE